MTDTTRRQTLAGAGFTMRGASSRAVEMRPIRSKILRSIAVWLLLGASESVARAGVPCAGEFAPAWNLPAAAEEPFRRELSLNGRWQLQLVPLPQDWSAGFGQPPALPEPRLEGWERVSIKIPSPWNVNSYGEADGGEFRAFPSYPQSWDRADMAWLRREFRVPPNWVGRRMMLRFEAVAGDCEVRVNGRNVGGQFDNFLPLELDITDAVVGDGVNELLVGVRAPRLFNRRGPLGELTYPTGSFFGLHIAGVWQDVTLSALPTVRAASVFVHPQLDRSRLRVEIELRNDRTQARRVSVGWEVRPWLPADKLLGEAFPEARGRLGTTAVLKKAATSETEIPPGATAGFAIEQDVNGELAAWTPEQPSLYGLVLETTDGGQVVDRRVVRFGWRQFGFVGRDLQLNGRTYRLKGEITHFMGVPYLSPRHAWAYYRMLKHAHVNTVRLHAMPHPTFYLDLADEMGLVVVAESGLWGSNCNFNYDAPEFWQRAAAHNEGMLRRDCNHPSIVGWSVMNECLAAIQLRTSDAGYLQRVATQFSALVARVRRLDPSRPYVVCEDHNRVEGTTANVIHYGGPEIDRAAEAGGTPWAITEDTQSNWSLPPYVAQWNGERAFEGFAGRMEGVGIEAYELLTQRQLPSTAFYIATYSVNWYGLEHLPLGHPNVERPPTLTDGVLFTAAFQEGKPGMQPERVAPYSTTLNPGYDPAFPLYRPTPYFEAVQAAFAPGGPLPCPWDQRRSGLARWDAITPPASVNHVPAVGDLAGPLGQTLLACGVPLVPADPGNRGAAVILVDASSLPPGQIAAMKQALAGHAGTVVLWAADRAGEATLLQLAPAAAALTDFSTTALLPDRRTRIGYAFSPAALYFAEASAGQLILRHGLAGPLVERGTTILRGNKTDWPSWRSRAESTRNQILARSENEARPSGAALVEFTEGPRRWLVSSLPPSAPTPQHREMFRTLFRQLGVQLTEPRPLAGPTLAADGTLQQALVLGPFTAESYEAACSTDFLAGDDAVDAKPGTKIGDLAWKTVNAGAEGAFVLNALIADPHARHAAAYLSFWVFCPRSDDLLENPRGAKLDMTAASDDGLKVWLNGSAVFDAPAPRPITDPPFELSRLSLRRGWNHFLLKVSNTHGDWRLRVRLQCPDPVLAPLLQTGLARE